MRTAYLLIVSALCSAQALVPIPDKIFEFHSGFWMNLDHFLREQAAVKPAPPQVTPAWTGALDYYRLHLIRLDTFADPVINLNNRLSELEAAKSLTDSGLDTKLIAILEAA